MQRLKKYFCTAEITPKEQRTLGLEIETLFTSDNQPISLETSQAIMSELIKNFSWDKIADDFLSILESNLDLASDKKN